MKAERSGGLLGDQIKLTGIMDMPNLRKKRLLSKDLRTHSILTSRLLAHLATTSKTLKNTHSALGGKMIQNATAMKLYAICWSLVCN